MLFYSLTKTIVFNLTTYQSLKIKVCESDGVVGVGVREGELWGGVAVYIDVYLMIVCAWGGWGWGGVGERVGYMQDKATKN